jgi:stringent starvation protein B
LDLGHMQAITDRFDGSGQHFEPGVWAECAEDQQSEQAQHPRPHGLDASAPAVREDNEPDKIPRRNTRPIRNVIAITARGQLDCNRLSCRY